MLSVAAFREALFTACSYVQGEPVLAAVSGGLDSVVLCDLLRKNNIPFVIAHVNFGLRGKESNDDEKFVAALAKELDVAFYLERCDEKMFAEAGEKSVQLAARKIRYAFFELLCAQQGLKKIAVAHHEDDSIETALLNFARGSGIHGLQGIAPVNGKIIRPLLFATREEIFQYAKENQLNWREDSSNETDEYTRNRFRHHLLPWLLSEIPQGYKGFEASFARLAETEKLMQASLQLWKNKCCEVLNAHETKISLAALREFPEAELFLRFFLREKGFSDASTDALKNILDGNSGAQLSSSSLRLIRDRDFLFLLHDEKEKQAASFFTFRKEPFRGEIPDDKWSALVDAETLELPLEIRTWQAGDQLVPFGMQGHRKVSDILNEMKLPLHQKEKAPVVLSGNEIVWVPGYRIAEKFRVSKTTSAAFRLFFNRDWYGS